MDHRATSLRFLKATGLIPVKIRPGQKDAFPDWDPRRAPLDDPIAIIKEFESNTALNIAGLFTDRFVDIDVDNIEPTLIAALDYFLPYTAHVWGRKSKPRSHRMYTLHEKFERETYSNILRFIKKLSIDKRSYSLEVRGGKAENALYSVLPGSIHPSKEPYEWMNEFDPTVQGTFISIHQLIRSVRLAVATAIVATYWMEGMRNDMALALSGLMWRIRFTTMMLTDQDEEVAAPIDTFILTPQDAKAILLAVMKIAGDDPGDQRSRMLNLENTWTKLDKDPSAKVTGGKVLAELIGEKVGEEVVKALYKLLSDSEGIHQLEDLMEQFVIWYGQGVLVDLRMVEQGHTVPWMSREQANASLGGKKISIGTKKVPITAVLFGSQLVQRIYGMTFDPSSSQMLVETDQGIKVNQWQGFKVEPCLQQVTNSEVEPFLEYVFEVLADANQQRADWVLDWISDLFQKPHDKPGTALVLVGEHGAGKTCLGEAVIGPIIGHAHYAETNSITQLTDKFNTIMDNKIFLLCDEAIHSYQKDVASKLKSLITEKLMTIEPKNINSFKKPNHLHFLFTSNEENTALYIDPSPYERRFSVLKVSSTRVQDLEYWEKFHIWVAANHSKLLRWFLDRKYNRKSIMRPVETEAKFNIQRVGVEPEISWMISRVAQGFPISERNHEHWWQAFNSTTITDDDRKRDTLRRDAWPDIVSVGALEKDYRSFIREHGRPVYSGSVITNIRKTVPPDSMGASTQTLVSYNDSRTGQAVKSRVRLYSFPSKQDILRHLYERYGAMVDKMVREAEREAILPIQNEIKDEEGEF